MAKKRPTPKTKPARRRVGAKIAHMMETEHVPQKQAVAMALQMEREHRLGPGGAYKRVKPKAKARKARG